MRYAITGTHRSLTGDESEYVYQIIKALHDPTEITTGAARGVDTVAFYASVHAWPDKVKPYKRIVVPAAPHNSILIGSPKAARADGAIIEYAEEGKSNRQSYMLRNERMIDHADMLVAFPNTGREELRSGTWATIRRARLAGIPVVLHPLDLA